jgi:hypothetical protein
MGKRFRSIPPSQVPQQRCCMAVDCGAVGALEHVGVDLRGDSGRGVTEQDADRGEAVAAGVESGRQ